MSFFFPEEGCNVDFYLICRGTEVIHEHLAINIFNGDPYPQLNFCPQSYSINQY